MPLMFAIMESVHTSHTSTDIKVYQLAPGLFVKITHDEKFANINGSQTLPDAHSMQTNFYNTTITAYNLLLHKSLYVHEYICLDFSWNGPKVYTNGRCYVYTNTIHRRQVHVND